MKRYICEAARWAAVIAAAFVIFAGGGNETSSADAKDVFDAVCAAVDTSEMQPGDAKMIRRLYGLDSADYESAWLMYPETNMGAEEILVIKFAEGADTEALAAAVNARLEAQKAAFDGYGVGQYELLTNHSAVELTGNFLLFVVNGSEQAALEAFRAAL